MPEAKTSAFIYPRLCVAYFFQFAIWGSWAVPLSGYGDVLKLSGPQIGWLYAAIPLGAVISPLFITPIADRFISAQYVVAILHFFGGLCLAAAGWLCASENQTFPLLMALILLSGMCYMPTIALVNTIVFKHMPSPSTGPYVFIFGTIGWIVVNLFIAAFLGGAATPNFFFAAAACSIFLAVYSLTLPNTPPKGAPAPGEKADVLGLGALRLFKDPGFAAFAILVFLASIPACNYFFPAQVSFLTQRGYPEPLALTTLNQFSEIAFMALLPLFIAKIGLKNVLALGMAAWTLRYFAFAQSSFNLTIIGLLLHGFCYSFLYVAAYMYADKKAPANLKASVQGLMAFLLLGVGQTLGSLGYGYVRDSVPPKMTEIAISASEENKADGFAALPAWHDAKMENSAWRYLDLSTTVKNLIKGGKADVKKSAHFGSDVDTNRDNIITQDELDKMPHILFYDIPLNKNNVKTRNENAKKNIKEEPIAMKTAFSKDEITKLLAAMRVSGYESVTRDEYFAVQANDWKFIWTIPAFWIGACFVVFMIFGREPKEEETRVS